MADSRNDRMKEIVQALRELSGALRKRLLNARPGPKAELDSFKAQVKARIAASPPFTISYGADGPEVHVSMRATGGTTSGGEVAASHDVEGFVLKYFEKDIYAAAAQRLDDEYTFGGIVTMSEDEKRKALKENDEQILALQREAVALQFEALAEGETVRLDPSFDPRALLGIDGPPMPRQRQRSNRLM